MNSANLRLASAGIATVLLVATAATFTARAGEPEGVSDTQSIHDMCKEISAISEVAMEMRQNGSLMADLMGKVAGKPLLEMIVRVAYKQPRFHSESGQHRAVVDFANEMYSTCIDDPSLFVIR